MRSPTLEKIDFAKTHKDLYTATGKIKEVNAAAAVFLSVSGEGEPGGDAFQAAIQRLYSLSYTTKFMLKNAGKLDFAVSRLECLWQDQDLEHIPKADWLWQLLIRIPDAVTAADLNNAREVIRQRHQMDTSDIKRWLWKEGRCIQVMHIGPYDQVGEVYRKLDEFASAHGMKPACPGHEIYISDPRRVRPEKLKTIVRLPVR